MPPPGANNLSHLLEAESRVALFNSQLSTCGQWLVYWTAQIQDIFVFVESPTGQCCWRIQANFLLISIMVGKLWLISVGGLGYKGVATSFSVAADFCFVSLEDPGMSRISALLLTTHGTFRSVSKVLGYLGFVLLSQPREPSFAWD